MSLLTIVQKAAVRCGITAPSSAISNADPMVQQLIALAQDEGDESSVNYDWRNLKIPCQFTGDGTSTLFGLPSDFDRWPTQASMYSSSYPLIPLLGPISDEELIAMQARPVFPVRPFWNMLGGSLQVWPALQSGEVVSSQYRSNAWILDADGVTRKAAWIADTDTPLIRERIIVAGVIWRWKKAKGLDYAEEMKTWGQILEVESAHDRGNRTVGLANVWNRFPDNSWPGVIVP